MTTTKREVWELLKRDAPDVAEFIGQCADVFGPAAETIIDVKGERLWPPAGEEDDADA